jgi:hypothetical protein
MACDTLQKYLRHLYTATATEGGEVTLLKTFKVRAVVSTGTILFLLRLGPARFQFAVPPSDRELNPHHGFSQHDQAG